jgi:pyruvate dehydrogenase E2 component (dihydrolipoamide acetyltransferase)
VPVEFNMPKLGLTMEEGTIVDWLVDNGTSVRAGMPVLSVETDKVTTDVEIPDGGRLHVVGEIGTTYKCGELIGWILADGEMPPSAGPASPTGASPTGASPTGASPVGDAKSAGPQSAVSAKAVAQDGAAQVPPPRKSDGQRLFASPFAYKRATELGVDIATVTGSGPDGRIVSEDVEEAAKRHALVASASAATAPASSSPATPTTRRGVAPAATFSATELARLVGIDLANTPIRATSADGRISRQDVADHVRELLNRAGAASGARATIAPPATQEPTSVIAMKGMRGTIASRMHGSLHDMAQLSLMMDADMDAVFADRNARKGSENVPGYTDYVIAAVARALRDHPRINSQITPEGIAMLPHVHVGMAVALDEGLVVPVVHNADTLSLESISVHTTRLAEAARKGALKLTEMEGGTFSVTALGMFGVDGFTPVINPPNVAILGVGRLRDEVAWSDDGSIRRVKRLTLSLTWDHRAIDGAPAAEFVRTVCRYLDDPSTLS